MPVSYVKKAVRPLYVALYFVVVTLAEVLLRLLYPIRTVGRHNLPRGGFVLAPNHISAIDPFFVIVARGYGRKMLVMGKEELFGKFFLLDFFWKVAGVFPVRRGRGDAAAVNDAVQEVKRGRGLLIFPEGTRSKDGQLGRLKSGAFVVAMQAGVPMVPCVVHYAAGKPRPFRRSSFAFGPPVSLAELGLEGAYSAKKLREAKEIYRQKLAEVYEMYKDKL